jgi:hypothetical protein
VAPVLDGCVRCGAGGAGQGPAERATPVPLVSFDPVEGGALCRDHRRGTALEPGVLEVIRRIFGGDLAAVLHEPADRTTSAVAALATSALEAHLERRLRAVHLLSQG